MAKLNGVKIIEMEDGAVTKIEYDGEEYIYEEGAQKKASNIVQNLTQTQDADIGSFYSVDSYGDVIDNVGDRHDIINSGGRTFVKAQETAGAKAGDLIRIVNGYPYEDYVDGDVFTVNHVDSAGDVRVDDEDRTYVLAVEFNVINPKEETPQVGDKILVYDAFISDDQYTNGDVLKVTEVRETGSVRAEGVDVGLLRREFEIVPTNTPVTKSSTCDKDDLSERVDDLEERVGKLEKGGKLTQTIEKGDTVRLDIPKGKTPRFEWGAVENGEIGEVVEVVSDNKVCVAFPSQSYWNADVSELVVVSKVGKERKPVEGDIVVITDNTNVSANEVGDIGIVTDILGHKGSPCVKVHGRKHGIGYNHTEYSDMRLATAEERAEYYRKEKAEELKVGDYARVTGETLWNGIGEGTVVKVTKPTDSDGEHRIELLDGSDCDYAKPENLEKIDVNARELSFIRAGREPREHKKGDIVRVEDACGSPLIEGNFYELSYSGPMATISLDSGKWAAIVTLVTPVESRTDIDHGGE